MRTEGGRRRLSRNVVVLSWVSFFQDAASEMLYPVLPLFITGVLGAPVSVLGLIEGVAEGAASVMKGVSGWLADRMPRRPLIAWGYGISSIAKPIIGLAGSWPVVLGARFIDRTGKGLRTSPRDALIAADTEPALRGRAFGLHRAADTAGAVLGPLLGLALYEAFDHHLRPMFFVAFVPAAASVALIALVREHQPPPGVAEPLVPGGPLSPPYWRVVAFLTLFGLVDFPDALLILRAKELGLGFVAIIGVYVLYNTVYAALSLPAGTLSDRVPRRLLFAGGLAVFAVTYAGLGAVTTSAWVWILLPFYGAFTALTDSIGKAWVSDLLPARSLGAGLGAYQGLFGGAVLLAGVWAGLAWGHAGRLPLLLAGAVAGVLAVILFVMDPAVGRARSR